MKINKKEMFKKAHAMTRAIVEEYPEIGYRDQFSLCLKAVYEDAKSGGKETKKETKKELLEIKRVQKMDKDEELIGVCSWYGQEYLFATNPYHPLPFVLGSRSLEINKALRKAISRRYKDYFKENLGPASGFQPIYDFSRIEEGIFVYTLDGKNFRGYWRNRAFSWNTEYDSPLSCSFETMIKDLDRPYRLTKAFRSMATTGKKLNEEIPFIKELCMNCKFMKFKTAAPESKEEEEVKQVVEEVKKTLPQQNKKKKKKSAGRNRMNSLCKNMGF